MQDLVDHWLAWTNYPSIGALGSRDTEDVFVGNYQIEEKVDGSQISFGKFNGEVKIKSKNVELILDSVDKNFKQAVDFVISISDQLHEGYVYRGEYLRIPKHNTLTYGRIPNNHIAIFDINDGMHTCLSQEDRLREATRLGFEVVPTEVHSGTPTKEFLSAYLGRESFLGGCKVEGIVIKNYEQSIRHHPVYAKYVSEDFKEIHSKEWKSSNPTENDILFFMVAKLKTNTRWIKAVQHLRDEGRLTDSPKDIGALIKEVQADVGNECEDMIKDQLYAWAWPHIQRGIVGGLAEWYKDRLLDQAIADVQLKEE